MASLFELTLLSLCACVQTLLGDEAAAVANACVGAFSQVAIHISYWYTSVLAQWKLKKPVCVLHFISTLKFSHSVRRHLH